MYLNLGFYFKQILNSFFMDIVNFSINLLFSSNIAISKHFYIWSEQKAPKGNYMDTGSF